MWGDYIYLYHYYDKTVGPFVSLSDLPIAEAEDVLHGIKTNRPNSQSASRHPQYMEDRFYYEEILRTEFARKGGVMKRRSPHYMVVGQSPWLSTWFEDSGFIKIHIDEFNLKTVSFTYGDSHPVFSPRVHKMDDKEYRRKLYTYEDILIIIKKYGLPQEWNDDGAHGPERYVEAHVWCDEVINRYKGD
jgi:hypothetical protein